MTDVGPLLALVFTPPDDTTKVELVTYITGHGCTDPQPAAMPQGLGPESQ